MGQLIITWVVRTINIYKPNIYEERQIGTMLFYLSIPKAEGLWPFTFKSYSYITALRYLGCKRDKVSYPLVNP